MIIIPGAKRPLLKIDIAARHVNASIQMIACEVNPYSTHLVVMAASDLLAGIAAASGRFTAIDHRIYIREERYKDWFAATKKAYNFFKHADRDAQAEYNGPEHGDLIRLNEIATMVNLADAHQLGAAWAGSWGVFLGVMMIKHPTLFRMDRIFEEHPTAKEAFQALDGARPDAFNLALRIALRNEGALPD